MRRWTGNYSTGCSGMIIWWNWRRMGKKHWRNWQSTKARLWRCFWICRCRKKMVSAWLRKWRRTVGWGASPCLWLAGSRRRRWKINVLNWVFPILYISRLSFPLSRTGWEIPWNFLPARTSLRRRWKDRLSGCAGSTRLFRCRRRN